MGIDSLKVGSEVRVDLQSPYRNRVSEILSSNPLEGRGLGHILESVVPPIDSQQYFINVKKTINEHLGRRKIGRTFTMISSMDNDSVLTYNILKYLFQDGQDGNSYTPIVMVYPRLNNPIDQQKEGRLHLFVNRYNAVRVASIEQLLKLQEENGKLPRLTMYEPQMDQALDATAAALGISVDGYGGRFGLQYNNALGTIINIAWKAAADPTKGFLIGILNGSTLKLGDYYRFAADGELYPLSSLLRVDVNRLLRDFFKLPPRLRDLSPWNQKVRIGGVIRDSDFWKSLESQRADERVKMLPRNFYRFADPVLYLLDKGFLEEEIVAKLIQHINKVNTTALKKGDEDIITDMVHATTDLVKAAEGKYRLNFHQFLPFNDISREEEGIRRISS